MLLSLCLCSDVKRDNKKEGSVMMTKCCEGVKYVTTSLAENLPLSSEELDGTECLLWMFNEVFLCFACC